MLADKPNKPQHVLSTAAHLPSLAMRLNPLQQGDQRGGALPPAAGAAHRYGLLRSTVTRGSWWRQQREAD